MPPRKKPFVTRKGKEKKFVISTPEGIQHLYQNPIEPAVRVDRRGIKKKN